MTNLCGGVFGFAHLEDLQGQISQNWFRNSFFSETNRNSTKTLTTRINKFEWCVYSRNWLIMEMSVAKGNKKDKVNFIFIINCIIFYQLCSSFHKWHFSITYK